MILACVFPGRRKEAVWHEAAPTPPVQTPHTGPHPARPAAPAGRRFYRLPDLEIRSGRIVTDGCRRVLDFAPQKITLDVGSTVITFYGTALRIESLNGKRLTVAGRVARIDFAPKWEVDANEAPHSGSR